MRGVNIPVFLLFKYVCTHENCKKLQLQKNVTADKDTAIANSRR